MPWRSVPLAFVFRIAMSGATSTAIGAVRGSYGLGEGR